jgi:hypothetical protein
MSIRTVSVLSVALAASAASAAVVDIFPSDPSWASSGNTGGGSSAITAGGPIEADGSVRLTGDRTRFGNTPSVAVGGYGPLSAVSTFKFQFATEATGAGVITAQAPALRVHAFEPATNRQIQFVWEDGEQSSPVFVNGAGSLNTVYTGDFFGAANRVYPFTSGLGRGLFTAGGTLIAGTDSAQPIGSLLPNLIDPNAWVFQISVGVGSSVGSGYIGWADRVQLGFTGGPVTDFNFLVPAPGAAALLGLGGLVAARRRRN